MDGGAIAGTVVGVVIAACLLAFCLYPVIVGRIKRRNRQKRGDAEAGIDHASNSHGSGKGDSHQRTSSSESCKEEVDLARGDFDSKAADAIGPAEHQLSRGDSDLIASKYVAQFGEEYMPQDLKDDQPGVLKGTSEDYYRVSIPSEAFGMVTQPEQETEVSKSPTPSRASSFTHNVRHMFKRTNSRDHTIPGRTSQDEGFGAAGQQRLIKKEEPLTESPIEHIYPTPPAAPIVASRAINIESGDGDLPSSPPLSPREIEAQQRLSVSPPQHPAPGTVNPMDIMPASTQSEHWHRTEHQLFSTSHESPKAEPDIQALSPEPAVIEESLSPIANDTSDNFDALFQYDDSELNDIIMDGMLSHNQLNAAPTMDLGRLPSNPSEQSTPLPGPAFTDASSQPTPSTQTDTPSPESIIGSDFRSSHSPQIPHPTTLSAKPHHQFRCDEPGCDQSFDQPHKLK